MIPCQLYNVVAWLLNVYVFLMLAYALVSWVPSLRGKWTEYIAMLVEPVLTPVFDRDPGDPIRDRARSIISLLLLTTGRP
jgi:hypothetical protein